MVNKSGGNRCFFNHVMFIKCLQCGRFRSPSLPNNITNTRAYICSTSYAGFPYTFDYTNQGAYTSITNRDGN